MGGRQSKSLERGCLAGSSSLGQGFYLHNLWALGGQELGFFCCHIPRTWSRGVP